MKLGMPLAEYEGSVGTKNKRFHEVAESIMLAREGVVPVDGKDFQQHAAPGQTKGDYTDSSRYT